MKISNIQNILLNNNINNDVSKQNAPEKFFDANFDDMEGLKVVKAENTEETQQDKKTYTKTGKDENGNNVTYTHNQKDDSLISKTTKYSYGYSKKEFYLPGTNIVSKSQEFDNKDILLQENQYDNTKPYGLKKTTEYDPSTQKISQEKLYEGGETPYQETIFGSSMSTVTKLKNDEPIESIVKRNDGTLKSATNQNEEGNFDITVYRKDGSVYTKGVYKDYYETFLVEETKYDNDGNIEGKTYHDDTNQIVNERYQDGILRVVDKTDARRNSKLNERTVYNKDGSVYFKTKYGSNGEVIDFVKNKNTGDPDYDEFKEKRLNGKIDNRFEQGQSGHCYVASTLQSFLNTEKGKAIIDKSIDTDKKSGMSKITFSGMDKPYEFTKDEIKEAMGRLGTGDPDFTALLLGYEKYRSEKMGKTIDNGFGNEVMKALCGNEGDSNLVFGMPTNITNKTLDDLQANLKKGNFAIVVNTPPQSVDTEFSKEENKKGFVNSHSYSLKEITDKDVFVINPTDQKTVKMSREKFLESFITFSEVELK